MTARRKTNVNPDEQSVPSLADLLSEGDSASLDSFGDTDPNTLQRLTYVVTALGGMVTYWYDSPNRRMCLSMRLGAEKKSYQVDTAVQFDMVAESVVSKLTPALQRTLKPPPKPPT